MERKTIEQFLKSKNIDIDHVHVVKMTGAYLYDLIGEYAKTERQIAVEETLREASNNAYGYVIYNIRGNAECEIDKQSILSLAPQIIEKLNNK